MRRAIKYIVPLVGILYCTAFFEVEVTPTHHQTFNDEYDTYTNSHSLDIDFTQLTLHDLQLGYGTLPDSISWQQPSFLENSSTTFLTVCTIPLSHKIFINNCTWLI